jgi:hypothetical protein
MVPLELDDSCAQASFGVRDSSAFADVVVEPVAQVGVALGEDVAEGLGLDGEGDDGQGAVGVFRVAVQDAAHGAADAVAFVVRGAHTDRALLCGAASPSIGRHAGMA